MKLRNEKAETGHLLAFISKEDRSDNSSLFFPVEGLEQFDTLFEISKGFEKCLEDLQSVYALNGYSISDYGEIEKTFPEIDPSQIFFFEQNEFLSESSEFMESYGKALLNRFIQKQNQVFPNIVTGAMADGSSFYDREDAVNKIWELLQNKNNILLRAPRRFGKTSLLNHITKHPCKRWQVCFVDLEGGDSAEKFVEKILAAMFGKVSFNSFLPDHLAGQDIYKKTATEQLDILRNERQTIKKDWKKYAKDLYNRMENSSEDIRFLFIMDEVSFLIEDMLTQKDNAKALVDEFMTWFGEARKHYKQIQFILSGSDHLPSFLNAIGINNRLDDLKEAHLDLFEPQIAKEFIFLVLAGQKITVSVREIDLILEMMGKPIPYFLHLFLDIISRTCKEKKILSCDDIISIYHNHLLGSDSKRYFESITKQIERYNRYCENPRNAAGAKSILDRLAVSTNSAPIHELKYIWQETTGNMDQFESIFSIMQDDFYLAVDINRDVFIDSKLIKDWWLKHGISGLR